MRKLIYLLLPVVMIAVLIGCGKDDETIDPPSGEDTGKLKLLLTDAPFPTNLIKEANVIINKIDIRTKSAEDGVDGEFVTLSNDSHTYNLLDLTNGVTATLIDMSIPVGTYDLIRLYVEEAEVVLKDETTFNLIVPSGAKTGIKVFLEPAVNVSSGLTTDLLLDFNVSKSFVVQGNPNTPAGINGFHFKPSIRASNLSTSGRIAGFVSDSLDVKAEGALISVMDADTVLTSSLTDSTGFYKVLGLSGGSYDLKFQYLTYDSVMVEDVQVVVANETTQDVKFPKKGE